MSKGRDVYEDKPGYGKEFTLAELEAFVAAAKAKGFGPDAMPRVRITMGGGIKGIEVDNRRVVKPNPTPEEDQETHEWFTTW